MSLVLAGVAAFGASILTFFSGFGLGTLLFPMLAMFMPGNVAVAATAVVHCANNLVKGTPYMRCDVTVGEVSG